MTKRFLFGTVVLLAGMVCLYCGDAVRYDSKTWRNIQTYDVQTLSQSMDAHIRQLVALKFNFRGKDIHHLKPNWYESSLWQPVPGTQGKFVDVRVMIAKKDLNAFKSIATASTAPEMTVYGRVERDVEANFFFVRLVGRNATVDGAGNATVTW